MITVERRTDHSALVKWTIPNFTSIKSKSLYSPYFEVGGFDCRLLVYPRGASISIPGSLSLYMQLIDPRTTKFHCFSHYKLSILNHLDESKSISRDWCYRFNSKKKSFGWCDFSYSSTIFDPKLGFMLNGSLIISCDVRILNESVSFVQDKNESSGSGCNSNVSSGNFTWTIKNFGLFREIINTHKLTSPSFQAEECNLRIAVNRSLVNKVEYLSIGLDSKETEKLMFLENRSCWCMFRMSVLNQKSGSDSISRELNGRFGWDDYFGDPTYVGCNDYMAMSTFIGSDNGFVLDDTAVFSVSFQAIKESIAFLKISELLPGKNLGKNFEEFGRKVIWRIKNFTRLKHLLRKRKITGLVVKSKRFPVGNQDFRLVVYPRGQSQRPCHLSFFLEATNPKSSSCGWSCFLHYRLSVVNQRTSNKSVNKDSWKRCSEATKDLGWHDFMTLNHLFDLDSGFLVQDTAVFSVEVLILKETFSLKDSSELINKAIQIDPAGKTGAYMWKMENFLSFKDIVETKNIASQFFLVGGCKLHIELNQALGCVCACLHCDPSVHSDPYTNFWVSYRIAFVNQKNTAESVWKASSFFTKTSTNSVLPCMKLADLLEANAGFLLHESVILVCQIIDCCPYSELSETAVLASHGSQNAVSTYAGEHIFSKDSEVKVCGEDKEDFFIGFLARAGFDCAGRDFRSHLKVTDEILMDIDWMYSTSNGLNNYLEEPVNVKDFFLATRNEVRNEMQVSTVGELSAETMILRSVLKFSQQLLVDLCINMMVKFCQHFERRSSQDCYSTSSNPCIHSESKSEIFYLGSDQVLKIKWPQQSEDLLGMAINALKSLDNTAPQGFPEPKRWALFVQNLSLILDKTPRHLQQHLIRMVPKMVDDSEHQLTAFLLVDQLGKPDADPALQDSVFAAISQLDFESKWECVLRHVFKLLIESNNGPHVAISGFFFDVASQSLHIPQAIGIVRLKLQNLGAKLSPWVLDGLCKTIVSRNDVAEAMLGDINSTFELGNKSLLYGKNELRTQMDLVVNQLPPEDIHFFDIYILIEMLSVSSITVKVSQVFERFVASGSIVDSLVAMVLERRHAQRFNAGPRSFTIKNQLGDIAVDEKIKSCPLEELDFAYVLGLADRFSLSKDSRVQKFVRVLYTILFKMFDDEVSRKRMLKRVVDRATSVADNCNEENIDLNILLHLVREEVGLDELVLKMMSEVAEAANADRATLRHRLRAIEDHNFHIQKERQAKHSDMVREKAILSKRLSESEAGRNHAKSELMRVMDRSAREKKELSEQREEVQSQLEWLRTEKDVKIAKLATEKKVCKDHLYMVEKQLSQLKVQNVNESKRLVKEKNSLAKDLKSEKAMKKRLQEDLKHYSKERHSLEDEVQLLKERIGQIEGEKQEKEEVNARYEAYVDGTEARILVYQQKIQSLESELREQMSQHAPLYGAGLDNLSSRELQTLFDIHYEGLRQISTLQQQRGNNVIQFEEMTFNPIQFGDQ